MLNLLIKDFILLKRSLWFVIFYSFFIFFTVPFQNIMFVMGVSLITYMLILSITAYDDKNGSEMFINCLPISRKEVVASRYISVLFFAAFSFVCVLAAGKILDVLSIKQLSLKLDLFIVSTQLFVTGLMILTYLPIYFKFGYMKAKFFNIAIFGLFFIVPAIIGRLTSSLDKPEFADSIFIWITRQSKLSLSAMTMSAFVVLAIVSFSLSVHFYNNREF